MGVPVLPSREHLAHDHRRLEAAATLAFLLSTNPEPICVVLCSRQSPRLCPYST